MVLFCNCHNLPVVSNDDGLCRKRLSEYQALVYFLEKGLVYSDAKQCILDLGIEKQMVESRRALDIDIATVYKNFQIKSGNRLLTVDKAAKTLRKFYSIKGAKGKKSAVHKTRPMFPDGYSKKSKTTITLVNKSKFKDIKSSSKTTNGTRPICVMQDCKRKAKKRYQKKNVNSSKIWKTQRYGNKCDLHGRTIKKQRSYNVFKRSDRK